jgi:pimeloyl-ACP methyl ester carboxylesterase
VQAIHRALFANGIHHHVAEQGAGPLVLLLHGWPEGWYSWRHQLGALARSGYRAVATDVCGYGQTDAPLDVARYAMRELVADAAGIVEALGERQAVVVGHDWGASIAWHCALLRPDRFRAVAGLSVALTPRPSAPPMAIFRRRFEGKFFYMLYFQEPGVAEAELEADPRRSLRLVYYSASGEGAQPLAFAGKAPGLGLLDGMVDPPALPPWLTERDLDSCAAEFARAGFRGGLNRYRNMDRDWTDLADFADAKIEMPALFLAGANDLTLALRPDAIAAMKPRVLDLRAAVVVPGAGHWIQQERPAETNEALLSFLGGLRA